MQSREANTNPAPTGRSHHVTTRELAQAKEAVARLLDALALPAYLFDIEPHNTQWEVRVDFPADDAWQSTTLVIDTNDLMPIALGRAPSRELLNRWRGALGLGAGAPDQPATGAGTSYPGT